MANVTDTFNRANASTLGSDWGNPNITAYGNLKIYNNNAVVTTNYGSQQDFAIYTKSMFEDDQFSEATVYAPEQGLASLLLRFDTSGNGYLARGDTQQAALGTSIYKVVNGVPGTAIATTTSYAFNGTMRFEVSGSDLTLIKVIAGVPTVILSTSDSTYTSGYAGIGACNNLDNSNDANRVGFTTWSGGPIAAKQGSYTDDLTIGDYVSARKQLTGAPDQEEITISDTVSKFMDRNPVGLSESKVISDYVSARNLYKRPGEIQEDIVVEDTIVWRSDHPRLTVPEDLSISDTIFRQMERFRLTPVESMSISDELVGYISIEAPELSESISASDTVAFIRNKMAEITEALTIDDTELRPIWGQGTSIRENLSISEVTDGERIAGKILYDTLSGVVSLYTEAFSIDGEHTLSPLTFDNQQGSFDIFNSVPLLTLSSDTSLLRGELSIYSATFGCTNHPQLSLLEYNPIRTNLVGALDIYENLFPPAIIHLGDAVMVQMLNLSTGLMEDITSKVVSLNVSYSINNYTAEMTASFNDEDLYERLQLKPYYGQLVFKVYVGDTLVGSFLFESRNANAEFGASSISVWGRTRTALMSQPYAKNLTTVWNTDTKAKTIADEIMLAYPSVTLQWRIMNYTILAGKVKADNRSPLEIIDSLASPVGGRLTTNFAGDLIVDYVWKEITLSG